MDFASLLPLWLDAFLIAPFRWFPPYPFLSFCMGSAILCVWCVIIGEITSALLFWVNRNYYTSLQDEMVKTHNLSVQALHAGNKEAYLAINRQAHERFGKVFFSQAATSMSSLWPLPFAFAWMALRFSDADILIPYIEKSVGYVCIPLPLYILARILFAWIRKYLPGFRRVEEFRKKTAEARGTMRSMFGSSGNSIDNPVSN